VPKTARAILDRMNEVTFNSSLMREIRGIVNIQKLSSRDWCDKENPYAKLRLHLVHDEEFMIHLGASSKFNIAIDFLTALKERGRMAADQWLKKNVDRIGIEATMDLSKWHIETPMVTQLKWSDQ
jgi:NTE family protein